MESHCELTDGGSDDVDDDDGGVGGGGGGGSGGSGGGGSDSFHVYFSFCPRSASQTARSSTCTTSPRG